MACAVRSCAPARCAPLTATALERPIQEFARYEFKYLLSLLERREIEAEIAHFMRFDGHSDPALDHSYRVRSLYFDTVTNVCFYEKTDGVKRRRKYRLRSYAFRPGTDAPVFFEEKGRYNERTYKRRISIAADDVELFSAGDRTNELLDRFRGNELVEEFVADILRRRIRAKILVDYIRRPYNSDYDENFRVTFDQGLVGQATDKLFPSDDAGRRACVAGFTILEIKFNRRIPAWFHRILQAHEMRRLSISKFVVGMKVCGLAVDLS